MSGSAWLDGSIQGEQKLETGQEEGQAQGSGPPGEQWEAFPGLSRGVTCSALLFWQFDFSSRVENGPRGRS